ncbi:GNAT family N-acetyltransferase [Lichenifustis flavocetrariae]|uniref:GNAT family N-acetyltransferase n=1 Tax=Lichenifustis flavocetrariae TaxID=2949735 RepID=A0AA41YZ29_9HYPH|nr:GNAT family N-acetyltransferase [Lichenifustis flavocetrariae]MCW6509941.1 GNAT family N-acetyltransferase [Lichenifustis flavocetrariae]
MNGDSSRHGTVAIHRFEPADQQAVFDVILPIQQEEFGIPITAADQPDLRAIGDFYQTGCGDFWVAKSDGRVVGTIALKDIGDRRGALRKMFVSASHRGSAFGVAAKLLDRLLSNARAHGVAEVYLGTTEKFVGAHRFYEKNGFRRIEREELPNTFPLVTVDTRFYRLDLDHDA